MLSTKEIASELSTTPKVLRQFLRQDETFGGVGSGARYAFDKKDLPRLKKRFADWAEKKGAIVSTGKSYIEGDGDPGMSVDILRKRKLSKREQDKIKAAANARVDRLEAALRSRGLHVSQMKR